MFKLMTPFELEVANTPEGVSSVKLSRERFYDKYAQDFHLAAGQILGCRILHGTTLWDVARDEACIILTFSS
jgi:hypothetical protein